MVFMTRKLYSNPDKLQLPLLTPNKTAAPITKVILLIKLLKAFKTIICSLMLINIKMQHHYKTVLGTTNHMAHGEIK
jgi:hypothetical protein